MFILVRDEKSGKEDAQKMIRRGVKRVKGMVYLKRVEDDFQVIFSISFL